MRGVEKFLVLLTMVILGWGAVTTLGYVLVQLVEAILDR